MNIKNKVSRDTINDVKLNRDSALNPPSADPGMDDFDWDDFGGTNDPFGGGNDPFGGGNDPFGGGNDPFGGGNDPFGGGNDPFGNGSDPWATPPVGGGFPPTSKSRCVAPLLRAKYIRISRQLCCTRFVSIFIEISNHII